jgi:hypothetical protein
MELIISKIIEIRYIIKGVDNYGFGNDKKCYNLKRSTPVKESLKNGCVGYWLSGKFYSQRKLKPLLQRPVNFDVPF